MELYKNSNFFWAYKIVWSYKNGLQTEETGWFQRSLLCICRALYGNHLRTSMIFLRKFLFIFTNLKF